MCLHGTSQSGHEQSIESSPAAAGNSGSPWAANTSSMPAGLSPARSLALYQAPPARPPSRPAPPGWPDPGMPMRPPVGRAPPAPAHPRVHVERDHLASARVVPAPLQPVAEADALQDLDEPAGPPGLADRPARAAGLQPVLDGPRARRRRIPATHRPRPPTARTPSAGHASTVR